MTKYPTVNQAHSGTSRHSDMSEDVQLWSSSGLAKGHSQKSDPLHEVVLILQIFLLHFHRAQLHNSLSAKCVPKMLSDRMCDLGLGGKKLHFLLLSKPQL